jgi:hypothetical protein
MAFFDSNLAPERLVGFESCKQGGLPIPIVRETSEFAPYAITLPLKGGGEESEGEFDEEC